MSLRSVIVATATLCAYVADAHIIMSTPVPYSVDKIDNSPITAAQFPCKSQNGFTVSTMNDMAVGSQQTIKFEGTAVHGGGSCQLSVTTDMEPTANSKFKVIKSIEGGCPGVDGTTNEYQFEIPDSVPTGNATFAWTWFSKMSGAPELYMNCAPIAVTGGASDTTAFDALPDMLVANIGEGCTTAQNFATLFPDPGTVVEKGNTNDQEAPTGSCGATGTTPDTSSAAGSGTPATSAAATASAAISSAGGNDGMYTAPAGASSAAATSAAAVPTSAAVSSAAAVPTSAAVEVSATSAAATSAVATSGAGGVFAPGASSAVASTQTTLVTVTGTPATSAKSTAAASVPAVATSAAGTGTAATSAAAPAASGSTGSSGSTTCTTNGAIVCNGTTQFGLCNNGSVVWQAVAAGTTCSNGAIQKRGYNGRVVRRRNFVSHMHKH